MWDRLRPYLPRIAVLLAFRYACFGVMIALCLVAEARPAPHLPDLLIDHVPYQPFIDRWNNWLLAACYLPVGVAFLLSDPARFCRYTLSTGLLSLLRGLCILCTGLGPVRGPDLHAGVPAPVLRRAWLELMSPTGLLLRDAPHLYLTKDLFFSGHTAVTFLIYLYVRRRPVLGPLALCAHLIVVASVFLSHLHYTIDVIGAYAVTYSLFVLREGSNGKSGSGRTLGEAKKW